MEKENREKRGKDRKKESEASASRLENIYILSSDVQVI
jgi:hypothetical protein